MVYRIAIVSVLVALAVCSAEYMDAMHPLAALLPASGATDITIIMLGGNAWQISYSTTADVSRQLEAQGWRSADERQYGPLSQAYARTSSFGVGEVWEWAFVWRDPAKHQIAHVRERRWIEFHWWQSLRSAVTAH